VITEKTDKSLLFESTLYLRGSCVRSLNNQMASMDSSSFIFSFIFEVYGSSVTPITKSGSSSSSVSPLLLFALPFVSDKVEGFCDQRGEGIATRTETCSFFGGLSGRRWAPELGGGWGEAGSDEPIMD